MNPAYIKVFRLYFAGYSPERIAELTHRYSEKQIRNILTSWGRTFVTVHLEPHYKAIIKQELEAGKNSSEIAKILNWPRTVVTFTIKRMSLELQQQSLFDQPVEKPHTFRCPICRGAFEATLTQISTNPDRICWRCTDRRNEERRKEPRNDDFAASA